MEVAINSIMELTENSKQRELVAGFFLKDVVGFIEGIKQVYKKYKMRPKYLQRQINERCDHVVFKGRELEKKIERKGLKTRLLIKEIKRKFREVIKEVTKHSCIMKWASEKPRGYPGDFKMLEMMYDNRILSKGIGQYLDNYLLSVDSVVSVRHRRDKMVEIMRDFVNKTKKPRIEMLDIGCGGARILRTYFEKGFHKEYSGMLNCTNVDQDDLALDYARRYLGKYRNRKVRFGFKKESIRNISNKKEHFASVFGKKDLIYNIGVADYLPSNILIEFIIFCMGILNPGGKFVVSYKDFDIWNFVSPDWFCNWVFVHRNLHDILCLLRDNNIDVDRKYKLELQWIKTEDIFYLILTKKVKAHKLL